MLSKILVAAAAACLSTGALAGSILEDRYTLRATYGTGDDAEIVFYGKGAFAVLGDLVAFDDYAGADLTCDGGTCRTKPGTALPHGLCYIGDVGKVCSLLSELSKNDKERYDAGDHATSRLDSCRALGRGQGVYARFEIGHDYEEDVVVAAHVIERCPSLYP